MRVYPKTQIRIIEPPKMSKEFSEKHHRDNVSIPEELSVSAAIAGITLSHQSVPVLGASNAISQYSLVVAVFVIIGVVAIYVHERLQTAELGFRLVRSGSILLVTYLIANTVNGALDVLWIELAIAWQSFLGFLVCFTIAILIISRRGIDGLKQDRRKADEVFDGLEVGLWSEARWLVLRLLIIGGLPVAILFFIESRHSFPSLFGVLSSIMTTFFLAQILYSPDDIGTDRRASSLLTIPGSIIVFVGIFGV